MRPTLHAFGPGFVVVALLATTLVIAPACTTDTGTNDGSVTTPDPGPNDDPGSLPDVPKDLSVPDGVDVQFVDLGPLPDISTDGFVPPPDDGLPPDSVEQPDQLVEPDVDQGPTGYPSDDLLIKIISPGGGPSAAVIGSLTTVGGLLFGDADTITWQTSTGLSGPIAEGAFWGSGPIPLEVGDTTVTVTATKGAKHVSDSIVITYNPSFKFDGELLARPNIAWVGSTSTVIFNIPIGLYANFTPSSVTLLEVDADGNQLASIGTMVDNGNTGSGDEVDSDGVFSLKTNVNCTSTSPKYYRVRVTVQQGASTYQGHSPKVPVWCAEHYTAAACQADQQVMMDADSMLKTGSSQADVIASLEANPGVTAAGAASGGGNGIWMRFNSGVLGAIMANEPGQRGGDDDEPGDLPDPGVEPPVVGANIVEVGSRNALVLSPFYNEFGSADDGPAVASIIAATECPYFNLEGDMALAGPGASLHRFRSFPNYGLISVSSHGDVLFEELDAGVQQSYYWDHVGAQEVLWSGEQVNCAQLLQGNQNCTISSSNPTGGCPIGTFCEVTSGSGGSTASGVCVDRTQADLRLGRIALTNKGYAMLPAFFEAYAGTGYPQSLINLGACRTMYNGSLAGTFFAHHAMAITGFSDYVQSQWAMERVVELFDESVGEGQIGNAHHGGEDPDNPGTFWRLLGAGNLDLSRSEIINSSFENGDATGWRRDGDGRVISQLGSSTPVHGKFMGLISTGLGFTVQTGTLEQDFCIPNDTETVEIYWKFFSEEFKEFCGSQFQDQFQAVLLGAGGQLTVIDLKIDDLCGYGDGSCSTCPNPTSCDVNCMGVAGCKFDATTFQCTGSYPCECGKYFVGLTPSDVNFDVGGVYNVLWQKTTKNVQALAGAGKVTLRLYSSDTGDSIYDTVVLIDAIKFK